VAGRGESASAGGRWAWTRRVVTVPSVRDALESWLAPLLIAFSLAAQVREYLADRTLFLDEQSLKGAIRSSARDGFFLPLTNSQLAPAGFVFVEQAAALIPGGGSYALRLFPLLSGIAATFLFWATARRCLRPRAALIALAMFAVADDLIYFASMLKPYIADVAAILACTLIGLELASGRATTRRLLGYGLAGAVLVWFSFPAVFALAGISSVLLASAALRKDLRGVVGLSLASLIWLASFVGVYLVALTHAGDGIGLWKFWDFAFPPLPPRSIWDATWPIRRVLFLFVNPLSFDSPVGPKLSALPAVVLCAVGFASMAKRTPLTVAILVAPGLCTLLASYLHRYPFHGRLVLFLIPSLLLLIAAGTDAVCARFRSRWIRTAVLASILLFPTLTAILHLVEPRATQGLSIHGDRRPASVDPANFPF
jgi:hypothetical protein